MKLVRKGRFTGSTRYCDDVAKQSSNNSYYHRGGPKKPSVVVTTWVDYKKAGPLLVSLDHRGTADGKPVRVFLSDVSVKLTGSDTFVNAQ